MASPSRGVDAAMVGQAAMTRAAALLLLAGCTPEADADRTASAPVAAASARAAATQAADAPTPRLGGGSALRADVSGLSADISDLRVRVTDLSTIVDLPTDVLFAFDSADLAPAAADPLRRVMDLVGRGGAGDVRVVGHTDAKGEDAYNLDLSLRRARAVVAWLGGNGVPAARLRSDGRGEAEPVAANARADGADDPAGRALNRRVAVVIPRQ